MELLIQLCSLLRRGSHLSNRNGRLCLKKEIKIVPCTIAYKLTPHGKSHQSVTMFAFTLLWSFCKTIPSQKNAPMLYFLEKLFQCEGLGEDSCEKSCCW